MQAQQVIKGFLHTNCCLKFCCLIIQNDIAIHTSEQHQHEFYILTATLMIEGGPTQLYYNIITLFPKS